MLPPTLPYAVRTFLQCGLSTPCTSDGLASSTQRIIRHSYCLRTTSPYRTSKTQIRLTELKLDLSAVPVDYRRAADAPAETVADRAPIAHPVQALTQLVCERLAITPDAIATLQVFKRSFDARKA